MSQRNLSILIVVILVSFVCYARGDRNPYARFVATGLSKISSESLERVPSREIFNGAMQGMVEVLRRHGDEHSQFFDESKTDPVKAEIRQQFGGIGVRIQFVGDPPRLTIVGPPDPGTPAAQANLLPGDQILAIDGRPTDDMKFDEALHFLRGDPGEPLTLTIRHEHQEATHKVELVREVINIESILGDIRGPDRKWDFIVADDPRIAHVRIASFGDRTAAELERVLNRLTAEGVEGVVLDLRDNPGGALEAGISVCELFLPPNQLVVETRGRDGELLQRYETRKSGPFRDLPLVVLVNQNSASAAEIVAACLQDHGRALIAGQRSFGKGTVQQLIPLESGKSLLKLTWASFWRPSGTNIHRMLDSDDNADWGVTPDEGLSRPLSAEEYGAYRHYRSNRDLYGKEAPPQAEDLARLPPPAETDEQLQAALSALKAELSGNAADPTAGGRA